MASMRAAMASAILCIHRNRNTVWYRGGPKFLDRPTLYSGAVGLTRPGSTRPTDPPSWWHMGQLGSAQFD